MGDPEIIIYVRTGERQIVAIEKGMRIAAPYDTNKPKMGLLFTVWRLAYIGPVAAVYGDTGRWAHYGTVLPNSPLTGHGTKGRSLTEAWRHLQLEVMGEVRWDD